MPNFRERPKNVEAWRYVGPEDDLSQTRVDRATLEELGLPVTATSGWGNESEGQWDLILGDPEDGDFEIRVGDWVIRDLIQITDKGPEYRYFSLDNDDFQETYESAGA